MQIGVEEESYLTFRNKLAALGDTVLAAHREYTKMYEDGRVRYPDSGEIFEINHKVSSALGGLDKYIERFCAAAGVVERASRQHFLRRRVREGEGLDGCTPVSDDDMNAVDLNRDDEGEQEAHVDSVQKNTVQVDCVDGDDAQKIVQEDVMTVEGVQNEVLHNDNEQEELQNESVQEQCVAQEVVQEASVQEKCVAQQGVQEESVQEELPQTIVQEATGVCVQNDNGVTEIEQQACVAQEEVQGKHVQEDRQESKCVPEEHAPEKQGKHVQEGGRVQNDSLQSECVPEEHAPEKVSEDVMADGL